VLRSAGVEPVVRVSGVDEDAVAASLVNPTHEELVTALAVAKAEAVVPLVAEEYPDSVIVGCDSMLAYHDDIIGKPGTPERARERWRAIADDTGFLITGHAVVRLRDGEVSASASESKSTTVHFDTPSEDELEAYIASGEPLHVAGGFTIDGLGGWFVNGIEGDHGSVIGISLPLTRRLLAAVGVPLTALWNGLGPKG
jgi:septum formation protein